jgi:hypothetical protein
MSTDKIEELRRAAQEAPMNKVFETHEGHRFLGTHSRAWADAGRRYADALMAQENGV